MNEPPDKVIIKETPLQIFLRFLKFGFLAWGGPVAQIAMIRQELVEKEKWISKEKFNRALAVYQVLPGPEAHELCVYFGMVRAGRWGGFFAGLGFMLPGFLLMLLFTWLYIQFGIKSVIFQSVFFGFQAAVISLIFAAVHRIGKHALVNYKLMIIAGFAFLGCLSGINFLILLPLAGLAYVLWMKEKIILTVITGIGFIAYCVFLFTPEILQQTNIISEQTTNLNTGKNSLFSVFLSGFKGGILTFGGAYTVIPFIQQDAVINNGWMTNEQFLDGIALSGMLPAPLIIFSTFVGYFGGGWAGALIMTAGIFLPAFAFTLLGHSLVEKLIENKSLHNFLDGVTAAVIGLIAFTAIQLFRIAINDIFSIGIFIVALVVLYCIKTKFTVLFVILGSGLAGLIYHHVN